ncbi:MAG: PaaI family thioesterase [Candidatus Azotimanducaceae bacterium WSBS_2022_MAG_OTU7]
MNNSGTNTIPDGYSTDPGFDLAEDHTGPFYYLETPDGFDCLFLPGHKNCNANGLVHGGVLMTFADFSLCMAATDHYREESCSTISFSSAFVSAASSGELIRCMPKVIRKTGSLVFVNGELESCGDINMTFSAVVKRLRDK